MNFVPDITKLERVVAPESLLTLDEAKNHLHVDHNDDDALIQALISAASSQLDGTEGLCGHHLVTQTWKLTFLPCNYDRVEIELPNVQAITEIKYYDSTNTLITADLAGWNLAANKDEAYIWPTGNFPSVYYRWDAMQIKFTVGYGSPENVPSEIKQAALLLIGHYYANREAVGSVGSEIPLGVQALLSNRRRGWVV